MTTSPSATRKSDFPRTFFSQTINTVQQIERVNAEGGIPVDFRPVTKLAPSFTFEGGQSQAFSPWRTSTRSGFLTVPKLEVDVITIRFVTEGTMVRRDHRRDYIGRPGLAMMVMFEAMRNEEASAGFAAVSGTVTRTALAQAHLALEKQHKPSPLPCFMPIVDATGLPMQNLMQAMDRIFLQLKAGVQDADLVFPLLEEVMIYRVLTAWPREGQDAVGVKSAPMLRPLKRAKDYIDGHLGRKLLLSDVANAAGVGVRRLQLVFKTEMGKTPVQFILEQRLDRVHADLRVAVEDSITVSTIATRRGFTHMGDFGQRYRARFGESPSITKRR